MVDFKLGGQTIVFIDYANIKAWVASKSLLIDLKLLYDFLKKKGSERLVFYYGTDPKNPSSGPFLKKVQSFGFEVVTKPVQYFHINLLDLLQRPINKQLLSQMNTESRKLFLSIILDLERKKISLLHPKANFDVEITIDSFLSLEKYETFVFLSGDGDFAPLLKYIKGLNKKIIVVAGRKFLSGKLVQIADKFTTLERFSKMAQGVFYLSRVKNQEQRESKELLRASKKQDPQSGS